MNFIPLSQEIHATKYRLPGESFADCTARIADALKDNPQHFESFLEILRDLRFLPGGRLQAAMGAPKKVTGYNCFVSGIIADSMSSIMGRAAEAAETMRMGGGIGYDFSRLRPSGDRIVSLDSPSSGPVSFMNIFDAVCKTISSAGNRRGAQMGVMRVDHPDIEQFVQAKSNPDRQDALSAFNISVGITDKFMEAVLNDADFELVFDGKVHKKVRASKLWDEILRNTWHYAEPGVLFLDTINRNNPLYYCEKLEATNPCGEQPLPPYGACLLGSFNLTQYLVEWQYGQSKRFVFNYNQFIDDIKHVVRAMDNVVDRTLYPLPEHEDEAKSKRRMGLGVTGVANTIEALGYPYGSRQYLETQSRIMEILANAAYRASANLAEEKGSFPLYDEDKYCSGAFFSKLHKTTQTEIRNKGLRNSHLLSVAPTGTISLAANNVSSGIEPVFLERYERTIRTPNGLKYEEVEDYGVRVLGVSPKTADKCSVDDHINALIGASEWVDSAVSKTCNVGEEVSWEQFKDIYYKAWKGGAKGCTTFRSAGKRAGILRPIKDTESNEEVLACTYDPQTGTRSCDQ